MAEHAEYFSYMLAALMHTPIAVQPDVFLLILPTGMIGHIKLSYAEKAALCEQLSPNWSSVRESQTSSPSSSLHPSQFST